MFADREGYQVSTAFQEVESGKKNDRPQLMAALARCRKEKATLIIGKLERLGCNVAFVSSVMESQVEFKAVDNPHAGRLMLNMLAAFAEHEREQISIRTKDALKAAKWRGKVLGANGAVLGKRNSESAYAFAERMRPTIEKIKSDGITTMWAISDELNRQGVSTHRVNGQIWHLPNVHALLKRMTQMTN